jgi:LacI family transcriptional regulator
MPRPHILVLVSTQGGYFCNIIRGIYRYATAHGGWDLTRSEPSRGKLLDISRFSGVIYCAVEHAVSLDSLLGQGRPLVDCSNWSAPPPGVPAVISDDAAAGAKAAEYLLGLGHRHFAFAGFNDGLYSPRRQDGFVRRLAAAGHNADCHMLYQGGRIDGRYLGHVERTIAWLRGLPKPCGLLVCADQDALHVSQLAQAAGISLPDDMAMIGVDDDDLACGLVRPTLTSVRMDGIGVGAAAAQAMDRLLSGAQVEPVRRLPPLEVVVRDSTDQRPVVDPVVRGAIAWLRQHATAEVSYATCARSVGVSLRTLQSRFASVLGHGPAETLLALRLDHAARLLAETDLPLKAVAARSGFTSAAYLCRVFAGRRGLTPGAYRAQQRPAG